MEHDGIFILNISVFVTCKSWSVDKITERYIIPITQAKEIL